MNFIPIAEGVDGLFIENNRFNTTLVTFNFYTELSKETVSEYSFLPAFLTSCSEKYGSYIELNKALADLYGANISAGVRKTGDYLHLSFSISVINDSYVFDKKSIVNAGVDMLLELIFSPKVSCGKFDDVDIAREKRKHIEHIKSEIAEKRLFARRRMTEEMFAGKPYGIYEYGTEEEIAALDSDKIYRAWKNLISTAYVRINVVGAELPDGLFEKVKACFETVKRANVTEFKFSSPEYPALKDVKRAEDRMAVSQGKLVMGFSLSEVGECPDNAEYIVMSDIFGGGPYSRLFTVVREKMSLCYYCAAGLSSAKSIIIVDSGVELKNVDEAEKAILSQLDVVKKGEFTDEEFNSSVKGITDSLKSAYDSQSALERWYSLRSFSNGIYTPEEQIKAILSVDRKSVVNAAQNVRLNTVYRLLPREEN